MASFFIDLDGVIFKFGTMEFNKGAVEFLRKLKDKGHQIVFSTARKSKNNNVPSLRLGLTVRRLEEANIEYDSIIGDLSSPRIVINDQGAYAINHEKDAPVTGDKWLDFNVRRLLRPSPEKILDSLLAMAWVSRRHGGREWLDADEYVQTILIARSLLKCKGFDHPDIVKILASDPGCLLKHIGAGGMHKNQLKADARRGAIWKLVNNYEKEYVANDGYTDGAAMRTLPIAAFYGDDIEKLVYFTNKISRITHACLDARLAAILVSLRFRQLLFPVEQGTVALIKDMRFALKILGTSENSDFFMERCNAAAQISNNTSKTLECLCSLIENIGMKHVAWSTPISAVFWSFRLNGGYKRWLPPRSKRKAKNNYAAYNGELVVKGERGAPVRISSDLYSAKMNSDDSDHVQYLRGYSSKKPLCVDQKGMDVDTFFSIAYGFLALTHGIDSIEQRAKFAAAQIFEDDLQLMAYELANAR